MSRKKFDSTDRSAVIRAVEKSLGVSLSREGRRQKWLRDRDGRSYWILGGYGEWHGIPEEMMDAEASEPSDGLIVVAIRNRADMQIYIGPMCPIVEGRSKLYRAAKTTGDYQFTYKKKGASIAIDQLPSILLNELGTFSFSDEEKEQEKRRVMAKEYLNGLSEEEKEKLLNELE